MGRNNQEILDFYCNIIAKDMFEMFCSDYGMITISDTEKVIYHKVGKNITIDNHVGIQLKVNGVYGEDSLSQTLLKGKSLVTELPKELFGTLFKAYTSPIRNDEGNIIGAYGISLSKESVLRLEEVSNTLILDSEKIADSYNSLSSTTNELTNFADVLKSSINGVVLEVNNTDKILNMISQLSKQSNLVGLNASIEAARAGEHGKGFSVVASEIRKMSDNSAKSVQEVNDILNSIKFEVETIITKITDLASLVEKQVKSTDSINLVVSSLNNSTEELSKISTLL